MHFGSNVARPAFCKLTKINTRT